jgi:formamidopyrimidine-DNA glycosylase
MTFLNFSIIIRHPRHAHAKVKLYLYFVCHELQYRLIITMVEGPGATRNARKLQPCVGLTVTECSQPRAAADDDISKQVVDAFSVGKEVFLVFSDNSALRLHFGMNGCLWLLKSSAKSTEITNQENVTMKLKLESDCNAHESWILSCRGTTVNKVSARVAYSKRDRLLKRDVCAEDSVFDANQVLNALKTRPTAFISDAILDQDRFPGVGNIIKMEGLHQAKVHPKRTVSSLRDEELTTVIHSCRLYARTWLMSGRAPAKHVYNQTICQSCQDTVRMAKLGNDLSRVTFWCDACQPLSHSGQKRHASLVDRSILINVPPAANMARVPLNPIGVCPQHGAHTVQVKRVRKTGANQNRLFFRCKNRACPYFLWADSHLKTCCGRKVLLRISKTERSGGRWFLSCQQCSFFAWATPQQLQPIQQHLTPLL